MFCPPVRRVQTASSGRASGPDPAERTLVTDAAYIRAVVALW
jgi:hypothetical protein